MFFSVGNRASLPEQERDAPKTRKTDNNVNNSAYDVVLTAEEPGDEVKLEKTDAAPVYGSDNGKNKGCSVKHLFHLLNYDMTNEKEKSFSF